MGAARLAELRWSRRNIARSAVVHDSSGGRTEGRRSRQTYPVMVAVHVVGILGTALWGDSHPRTGWLAMLLGVQPLRAWVLATLGERWNARGSVAANTEVATGGPYAYVRHPNYLVVGIELLALPMAFGLRRLAAGLLLANAVLVAIRIRDAERLLRALPGWTEHFARKKRFIPGLV